MLDLLLVTMSFIAAISMMFLCWLGWTMSEQLKHNDNVINELQDEIDKLRTTKEFKDAQIGILKTNINNLDTQIVDLELDIEELNRAKEKQLVAEQWLKEQQKELEDKIIQ